MRLFGSLKELVAAVFRKDSQEITLRPNQSTTYTAARDIQLPPGDTAHVLSSASSSQTLTNKTIDGDDNTVQDLPITAIKTVLGDADKVLRRDASGVPQSGNTIPNSSALVTTDASQVLTGKTIDGDDNTLQDVALTSIKTVLGDADKVIRRDASGVIQSGNTIPNTSALVTTDATQALTGKTIDGDSNTVQDLPETAIKTNLTNASKFFTRDASGVPESATKAVPAGAVVGTTDTQQLTNKDIDGGTASNTSRLTVPKADTATLSGLTRKQGTLVYDTSLSKFFGDNGTSLVAVGSSGSGSGEINAVLNPSAADDTTGYSAGTSHTVTRVTSGSPLDPVTTTAIQVAASTTASESSTSGGIYTISTLPVGLRNRKLKVEFYYTTSASQTWAVSVYRGGTRVLLSTDNSSVSALSAGVTGQKFTAYLDTDSSTAYTINFTRTAGSGSTNLTFTNLIVGPGIQPQGAIVSDWQSYTPTLGGFGTVSNVAVWYRRVGSSVEVHGSVTTGTTTAAAATIGLPTGLNIDTSKVTSGKNEFGNYHQYQSASLIYSGDNGILIYDSSSTSLRLVRRGSSSTAPDLENANALGYSNNVLLFKFTVPVAEWAGSGTLNTAQNDVEYASNSDTSTSSNSTSFAYGPEGSLTPSGGLSGIILKRVRFPTPIQATDQLFLEVYGNDNLWQDVNTAAYKNGLCAFQYQAGQSYGMGLDVVRIGGTDVDVAFGQYVYPNGATWASAGASWSGLNYRWRLRKQKAGVAVGFGLATSTQAGLVTRNLSRVYAKCNSGQNVANTIIKYETEVYDTNNEYNTSTGVFTASRAMRVRVSSRNFFDATHNYELQIRKNSSMFIRIPSSVTNAVMPLDAIIDLAAGDTIDIYAAKNSGTDNISASTNISNLSIEELL